MALIALVARLGENYRLNESCETNQQLIIDAEEQAYEPDIY